MTDGIAFHLEGVPEFEAALEATVEQALLAARAAVVAGAALIELRTKAALTTYTHPKGEPTTSPPGQPPALVEGSLRRSVRSTSPEAVGDTGWRTQTGPTIVYARIQELSGMTGRGHRTRLPARPYLIPTVERLIASGELWAAMSSAWAVGP